MATAAPTNTSVLIFKGLVENINGSTDAEGAANFLNAYDELVLVPPGAVTATPGVFNPTISTPAFFATIAEMRNPVWIYVDCRGDDSRADNLTRLKNQMSTYYNWFTIYNVVPKLKGFYLDYLGFDVMHGSQSTTRLHQSQTIQIPRLTYRLPVITRAFHMQDLFTTIGPSGRGEEQGNALWPGIIGTDPVLLDRVHLYNPIINHWDPNSNPVYVTERISTYIGMDNYFINLNVELFTTQFLQLSAATYDGLLGLTLDDPTKAVLNNFNRLMRALGYFNNGAYSADFGIADGKVINGEYWKDVSWQTTDHIGSNRPKFFSKAGSFYVENTILDTDNTTAINMTHQFTNTYTYVSSTPTPH